MLVGMALGRVRSVGRQEKLPRCCPLFGNDSMRLSEGQYMHPIAGPQIPRHVGEI